jgi:hypothetical protein
LQRAEIAAIEGEDIKGVDLHFVTPGISASDPVSPRGLDTVPYIREHFSQGDDPQAVFAAIEEDLRARNGRAG